MLKHIDPVFTPDLLAILARMGHSDEIAIVDENYPAYSSGRPVVHVHGLSSTEFVEKLCVLFPVDDFTAEPVSYMADPRKSGLNSVHAEFLATVSEAEGRLLGAAALQREAFYERARGVAVVVVTQEPRPFGCFIVSKGVWPRIELNGGPDPDELARLESHKVLLEEEA